MHELISDFALEPKMEVSESLEDHVASLADKEGIDKVVGTTGLDLIASQIHQMEESDDSEIVEVDVRILAIYSTVLVFLFFLVANNLFWF